MGVRFSADIEREELEERKKNRITPTWEHFRTSSLVEAVHRAKEMGWAYKKVQVRMELVAKDAEEYVVEPYEMNCGCPNILKYADFFLRPDNETPVD
jgi:hypothetical protein